MVVQYQRKMIPIRFNVARDNKLPILLLIASKNILELILSKPAPKTKLITSVNH